MRLVTRAAAGRAAGIALLAAVAVAGALPARAASAAPYAGATRLSAASSGSPAVQGGRPSWSAPPAGDAGAAAAKLRAAPHRTAPSNRTYEGANPPSPCYYSIWQEDSSSTRDASQIDGDVYAAMYDCPSATWSFPLQTYDSWPSSELSFYAIPIDTDFNPSTGCGGFEWLLTGTYDPGSGSLVAGLFSTPDCNTANQVADAGITRANSQQVTLTLPNSALGNATNIRWVARTQGTGDTNAVDTMPDTNAVPNYHQEDGYTRTGCTVDTLGAGSSSTNSYAAVDDPPAAAAALEADGRPGVRAHGTRAGVVHYAGDPFAGAVVLARHGIRATVSPDHVRHYTATPNDPQFSQQWGLQAVGASAAWDVTQGSSLVIVGDLDSGVDATHPDLAGKLLPGEDETTNPPQPLSMTTNTDDANHGTAT
ncbi:MAG: hypothetical protein JO086_16915, partial [Acidimicrobiia bacterium]|nr:hypothetical protein [Acidimicrobiia bacterium]